MFRRLLSAALPAALLLPLLLGTTPVVPPRTAVLVVGGTPAGVAAALAAARRGADVVLVARRATLGGILSDAMMDQWDLNVAPAGGTIQAGLFREIHATLGDAFTPAAAARTFARLVAREPRIRLVTRARAVELTALAGPGGRFVDAVSFAGARGMRFVVRPLTVIDATDDGDVAAMAGARYDLGRQDTGLDQRMQPVTLMFTLRDVDWHAVVASYTARRFGPGGAGPKRAWGYGRVLRAYRPLSPDVVVPDLNCGHERDGEVTVNAVDVLGVDGRFSGELTRARDVSLREAPHLLAFLRARIPGFARARLGRYADAVYVRETRHFVGVGRLTSAGIWRGAIPSDTIGLASYPLDLHPVTRRERLAYAPERHVYGVPFGALVPRDLANLILASPAISATHVASGSARVIPTTIEEGEAAGVAAALAAGTGSTAGAMARSRTAIALLRRTLRHNGAVLSYTPPRSAPS